MANATYKQVSAATRRLMKADDVFTEIDVVNVAYEVEGNQSWGDKQWRTAANDAQQVCAALYRSARLVRFGPVQVPGLEPDYARRGVGGKIVYAPRDTVKEWKTPNGNFPALNYFHDEIKKASRRKGIDRDDSQPWAGQKMGSTKDDESLLPDLEEMRSELERAQADLKAANKRNDELQAEVVHLRANGVPPENSLLVEIPVTDDFLDQLVDRLRAREPVA